MIKCFEADGKTWYLAEGTTRQGFEWITRRDFFAGCALMGMLAHSRGNPPHGYRPANPNQDWHYAIAGEAFSIADAMIQERGQ